MANIPLIPTTFTVVPEGDHVFKITKVDYKEKFGKLNITMVTDGKGTHIERFSLMKADGSANNGAYSAFSYFAKTALNNFSLDSVDPNALIGCYIGATVNHTVLPKRDNPNETVVFTNLGDKWVATDYSSTRNDASEPTDVAGVSLDALLD